MIEIERKFRLTAETKASVLRYLAGRHGETVPVHQSDQVFLQGASSFRDFKPGMPVVRLRTVSGKAQLAYKRAVNQAGDSLEYELAVGSAETMQKILEEMGYRQVTLVVKDRIEKQEDGLTLALDAVARLGDFLEIEVLKNEADQGEAEAAIMRKASEFGLKPEDIETKKYDVLLSAA